MLFVQLRINGGGGGRGWLQAMYLKRKNEK